MPLMRQRPNTRAAPPMAAKSQTGRLVGFCDDFRWPFFPGSLGFGFASRSLEGGSLGAFATAAGGSLFRATALGAFVPWGTVNMFLQAGQRPRLPAAVSGSLSRRLHAGQTVSIIGESRGGCWRGKPSCRFVHKEERGTSLPAGAAPERVNLHAPRRATKSMGPSRNIQTVNQGMADMLRPRGF